MTLHVRAVVLPDDEVRDLYLTGDRVSFEPVPGATTIADRGFAIPGLVDAHCHLGIAPGSRPISSLAEARAAATVNRDAGVLTIRDAGSPFPYPELDDDAGLPRLARAGRHIAPPARYMGGIAVEVTEPELAAAVTEQARAGNGWVKLVGDWIDRPAGDLSPTWNEASLATAVAAAHAAGARITAHLFAEDSVAAAVRAGVDCVEHGTGLSDDVIAEMARRGTALVPTMINIETFGGIAASAEARFPVYAAHLRRLAAGFHHVVAAAYDAGVPVYAGTDAGGGIAHGLAAAELELMHRKAGLPATAVLAAASFGARDWLGFPGLTEGGLADLVIVDDDPRTDLSVLRTPRRIVLRGRVIR